MTPEKTKKFKVDLYELIKTLVKRGIEPPILVRFDGIVRDRARSLLEAFNHAIDEFEYKGRYILAYPVKVNQQRHVVDSVRQAGMGNGIGLEVGSKPELLAVLAIHDTPDGLLLCNGYKDAQYIELALLAKKLGRRPIIIIEHLHELETVIKASADLGIEAEIGIRMKPASRGSSRWDNASGVDAKFGLSTYKILQALEMLRKYKKLEWVKLLHYHVGSQITSISAVKKVLKEAGRMYAEIAKHCPALSFFDVGGGLGVDYDGSSTNFESSMNYTMGEYARDVVWEIQSICDQEGLPHPNIVSESGRAVVAHHSMLITEVMDVNPVLEPPAKLPPPPVAGENSSAQVLYALYNDLTLKNCHESYNDVAVLKEEVLHSFVQGNITLEERAYADKVIEYLLAKISRLSVKMKYIPEDLEDLKGKLRDIYFCNFSVFQSLPDAWAIGQLFPIMPIHRLKLEPKRRAIIADMTCDSDGKIDRFIDLKDINSYIKLHAYKEDSPYYLGFFLVGAYQEILGDLHNLFGDTNAVHIDCDEDEELEIREIVEGDTVREVLSYVQFEPQNLLDRLRSSIERALKNGTLSPEESRQLQKRFKEGLEEYTYLQW